MPGPAGLRAGPGRFGRERIWQKIHIVQASLPAEGETEPLTQAKFEAWRTGLLQNWGYSPEDAKLRLQGSWQPAGAPEPEQDRAPPFPKLPPNLPGQSWKLSLVKHLSGPTMRPIWAITTLSTILKSSTGKAGKTGKSRNSRRKSQAERREILSDMLDGMITLEEGEARWTAPSMGGSLEDVQGSRQPTPRGASFTATP